jgi:hypothetical protein
MLYEILPRTLPWQAFDPILPAMITFAIIPRGREYWIEAKSPDGSRQLIERHDSEDMAVQRLQALHASAAEIERRSGAALPEGRD